MLWWGFVVFSVIILSVVCCVKQQHHFLTMIFKSLSIYALCCVITGSFYDVVLFCGARHCNFWHDDYVPSSILSSDPLKISFRFNFIIKLMFFGFLVFIFTISCYHKDLPCKFPIFWNFSLLLLLFYSTSLSSENSSTVLLVLSKLSCVVKISLW